MDVDPLVPAQTQSGAVGTPTLTWRHSSVRLYITAPLRGVGMLSRWAVVIRGITSALLVLSNSMSEPSSMFAGLSPILTWADIICEVNANSANNKIVLNCGTPILLWRMGLIP